MKVFLNKKLNSFTLMEMIVVMAITSVVIVITLSAYTIIRRQFLNYQKQSRLVNEILHFANTFENDTYKSNEIMVDGDLISIVNEESKYKYIINDHEITRQVGEKNDVLVAQIPIIEFQEHKIGNVSRIQVNFILPKDTLMYFTTLLRTSNK